MSESQARVLIVDDEKDICDILFRLLKREGFMPLVAHDGAAALEMIRMGLPDVVLLDVKMPGIDGMEVLKRSKKVSADLPIIMMTAWGGIDGAVQAVKEGALDYLPKPLDHKSLVGKIREAVDRRNRAQKRKIQKPAESSTVQELQAMMGPSPAVRRIISEIALVAPSNFSVVIQGETGTGKELVAKTIHNASLRSEAPMIPVDCGAIPETLFESELFGYEKGAFTGASAAKPGKFEMAQGGTLFLDEIANLPLNSQIKLLRAIQEKSFFRVGGTKPVNVDVRLIVATNEDLNMAVRAGSFSRDLFYRLSEFTIVIPPLRERKEDILHIAKRLIEETNKELNKDVKGLTEPAVKTILNYEWPGNVRQLKSAIRRAVLQAEEWISPAQLGLDESFTPEEATSPIKLDEFKWGGGLSLKEMVRRSTMELERQALIEVLRKTGGNKAKAARLLQIDYTTIHAKIKQYGIKIDPEDEIENR